MPPVWDSQEHLSLRLPVVATSVTVGRRAAAQFAEETGCDAQLLWRVRLAVSEAISNVVLHAHADDERAGHHLALIVEASADRLQITVCDQGLGMRARSDSPGMGAGLWIISSTCDRLALDAVEGGGTAVRMTFQR